MIKHNTQHTHTHTSVSWYRVIIQTELKNDECVTHPAS